MAQPTVEIYTDGSFKSGEGGWAATLYYRNQTVQLAGHVSDTTSNRMELTAILEALKYLKRRSNVVVYTDSQYAQQGMIVVDIWQRRGWKNKEGKEILNKDLWEQLLVYKRKHNVNVKWIKGHAGHPDNEAMDALAKKVRKSYS